MRCGSLFSGIGGFDLAARWMGWRTRWYSEVDPFCNAVMAAHFPEAKPLGDITQIDWTAVEPVDLLMGGFPCQDVSQAGARAGIAGPRSGLWAEFARAVRDLRPRFVVVENVPGLLARGMDRVLGDLAALGYDAEWRVLSAADVGAPHRRERVWITAYPQRQRVLFDEQQQGQPDTDADRDGSNREVADANGGRRQVSGVAELAGLESSHRGESHGCGEVWEQPDSTVPNADGIGLGRWAAGTGPETRSPAEGPWLTEPDVGRLAHGVPNRVAQLRSLGNAIVPRCAFEIFQGIAAR